MGFLRVSLQLTMNHHWYGPYSLAADVVGLQRSLQAVQPGGQRNVFACSQTGMWRTKQQLEPMIQHGEGTHVCWSKTRFPTA